jgi:hypothetical protein
MHSLLLMHGRSFQLARGGLVGADCSARLGGNHRMAPQSTRVAATAMTALVQTVVEHLGQSGNTDAQWR